jgi:hypothetical protein
LCKFITFFTSEYNIRKLQRIQNTQTRIVVGHPLAASSSELLYNLHWLPVYYRMKFKITLLTFKILTLNQPSYLSSLLSLTLRLDLSVAQAKISFISPELAQSLEVVLSVQPHLKFGTPYPSLFALLLPSPPLSSSLNLSTSL